MTFLIFLVLKVVHYIKWGYDEEIDDGEKKEEKREGAEEDTESRVINV